ncbi:MAG: DUF6754 domain-containing protein [Anaerolineae bacterium]
MEKVLLVFFLLIWPVLFYLTLRVKTGKAGELRSLPGITEVSQSIGHSAETGQPLHVSVGVAGVGGAATAETWAGLSLLSQIADKAAACDTSLIVTVADATALPIAQDLVRRAYTRHGNPEGYDPTQVRFIAPVPMAYAAGVMGLLERQPLMANVMVGTFGDEYLLMGETGARRQVPQIVGATDPQTLPLVYASADHTLIGEETFAVGAYTKRLPIQIGSLLTEDWARWAVIAVIVIAAIAKIVV